MATRSSIMDTNSYRGDEDSLIDKKTLELIKRREKFMSGSYRLFYRKPINLVRGEGEYLYDDAGVKYLDMYNNVASIGHCHPAVVEAVTKQMQLLNTHTRYLHETIVDYSEKILAKMPSEVDKVMFMCTGSEANDLALRVAQEYTGGKGIIVSQEAYHGTSALTSGCSPALGTEQPILPYVRLLKTPDFYRVGGTDEKFIAWYCGELQKNIDDLKEKGYGFACFLADSIFSSDGVHPNPKGFVKAAVDVVHKNGGVFIADEVQPGFVRTGDAFWGFARHGIVPDLVTMGKPMGNGIPVSGLAARHEVLEAFSDKLPYFNTFGGNPVAMAAAQAVLKVIEEEKLQEHTKAVGANLLAALKEVQKKHSDVVGDVRGAGLFIGFELVSDIEKKTPDQKKALDLIELLRDNQVLTSVCGPHGNVLKIRPTLAFADKDIDWVCSALDKCLTILG
ncbi:MAG: aspartate aminotransferase family protein [Lachnospiraceae bacterium]|nr:aspartate aminotransferase family protein [Lachnospiraceae bacterium]